MEGLTGDEGRKRPQVDHRIDARHGPAQAVGPHQVALQDLGIQRLQNHAPQGAAHEEPGPQPPLRQLAGHLEPDEPRGAGDEHPVHSSIFLNANSQRRCARNMAPAEGRVKKAFPGRCHGR